MAIQNKQIGEYAGIKISSDYDIPDDYFDNEIGSERHDIQIGCDVNTWMCCDGKHPR